MTLEDALIELGLPVEQSYRCSGCKKDHAPFAMIVVDSSAVTVETVEEIIDDRVDPAAEPDNIPKKVKKTKKVKEVDAVCTECIMEGDREQQAIADEAENAAKAPWDTDLGLHYKAERNRLIDAARWAVDPLTSPLSGACQTEFVEYIHKLNKLTLDFSTPEEVEWPTLPELQYPTEEEV